MSIYLNGKNISGESNNNANKDLSNLSTTGQAKFNAKQNTITGGASTITSSNLTANRALISNTTGKVSVSAVTSTELSYLDGVTSNIQTQLNKKVSSPITSLCTTAPAVKSYGFIRYGSLAEDKDNFAGFSSANYAQINTNFAPSNLPWEMNYLVATSTNVNSEQEILSDRNNRLEVEIRASRFALEVLSGSVIKGTYTVLPSTVYEIKIRFTGTQYILSYSTNGEPFIDDVIVTNSNPYDGSSDLYI